MNGKVRRFRTGMLAALTALGFMGGILQKAAAVTQDEAVKKVNQMADSIESFRANLLITDTAGGVECVSTSSITVSKALGFKTDIVRNGTECRIVSDYKTGFQYLPQEKQAIKMVADKPELQQMFRKPATDMNPLLLLDAETLKFKGEETFQKEPVYRFEGTTVTQFLADTPPVTRKMEAWISTRDGLPRKTIEKVEGNQVTTVYSDVEINVDLKPGDFEFQPDADVNVIDANKSIKEKQERRPMGQPRSAPRRP